MLKNFEHNKNQKITRGDIFWADIPDTNGSEQHGVRPVLVVSNDKNNAYSPCVTACILTTKSKSKYLPVHIDVGTEGGLSRPSVVCAEQTRTLDKNKLGGYIGKLPAMLMNDESITYPTWHSVYGLTNISV